MWKETDLEYMKNKYKINRGVCLYTRQNIYWLEIKEQYQGKIFTGVMHLWYNSLCYIMLFQIYIVQ